MEEGQGGLAPFLAAGQDVVLVGGGNSAGQAVVCLAPKVKRLHLIVRGAGLEASMSHYLIERIAALPNVELHTGTDVVSLQGDAAQRLASAEFRDRASGATHRCTLHHVFLFVGADPNSAWVDGCVQLDHAGFVVTGAEPGAGQVPALPLETDRPGVFAIGDVRAGSVKRVAAAVGEGAAVVAQIHQFLARRSAVPAIVERAAP
jgi:thioredoxin reductase (NADPH)